MTETLNIDEPIPFALTDGAETRAYLPSVGVWIVDTASETYEVDVEARTAKCLNMAEQGAGRHAEPSVFAFDVVECEVGQPLLFDAGSSPLAGDVVVGITRAHDVGALRELVEPELVDSHGRGYLFVGDEPVRL